MHWCEIYEIYWKFWVRFLYDFRIFFLNPITPRLFSNRFPLGGGRHFSHPVKLHTKFFGLKKSVPVVWGQAELTLESKVVSSNLSDTNSFSSKKEKLWLRFEHMTFETKVSYACP